MVEKETQVPVVALVGNPNSGKTTLFNLLTGANEKVGNYAGVTVDVKWGKMFTPHGKELKVLDLPGCYSLRGVAPDEKVTSDALKGELAGVRKPDLVVCVLDASAMERHIQLALQVLEMKIPVVMVLNMVDVAEKAGLRLDVGKLSEELGVPVVAMEASRGRNVVGLKQALRYPFPMVAEVPWDVESEGERGRRAYGLKLCELAARRPEMHQLTVSDRLDRWLLHRVFGWVFFVMVVFAVFWTVFSLAEWPMGVIESGQEALAGWIESWMADGDLRSLLVTGVVEGVGGVVKFVPQIVLLFLMIGLLESSGYMARAVYLLDGVMSKVGLSGKSFLPLFSSYACAIPGVMAARTIHSAKERMVAIFVAPWMSCSARMPVYFLIIPMLLGKGAPGWQSAAILFAVYGVGTISALVVAKLLRKRLGADPKGSHFILELPAYRVPQWRYIMRHVVDRAWAFLKQAGTVILAISVVLWALKTYPKTEGSAEEQLRHSVIGRFGEVIEPVVRPLGFDGRVGTAILTSFAAREVFNSTIGILFGAGEDEEDVGVLADRLQGAKKADGTPLFTPLSLVSLLIFYIYALQCLPTSIVVAKETGSWKWSVGQFFFMMVVAYGMAWLVYQVGGLIGIGS